MKMNEMCAANENNKTLCLTHKFLPYQITRASTGRESKLLGRNEHLLCEGVSLLLRED